MIRLNLPGTKVKTNKTEMQALMNYLNSCSRSGFTGPNNYGTVNYEREYFFKWHLLEFTSKVATKLLKLSHEPGSKKVTLLLSEPEQYALSAMFKRVDCGPYMIALQTKFITGLTPMRTR
jgi:hypothetical protein